MFDFIRKKPVEQRDINIPTEDNEPFSPLTLSYMNYDRISSSMTLSAVFCAVEMIANSVASLPIHIKDKSGNVIDHWIDDVFKNNLLTKFILIKQMITDMIINGNAFCYINRKNGRPESLTYLPKGMCSIIYNQETRKLTYNIPSITSKPVQPKDVVHILKNSLDGINGRGLLYYASRAIGIANAADKQAENYFTSGAGINGILKSSKHLSKKQQQEILTSWNQAHSGLNGNGIAVLPVDLDWIQIGNSAQDAQLLETRLYSVTEVARYLCISPVLLQDLSHSSYSTLEASQLEFLTHTLTPYIQILQDEFNRKLVPDGEVIIDWDELHLLKSDKQSTANYLSTLIQSGILSINEARHILDYEPISGGDEHIIAYTDINQNTINKNSEPDGDKQKNNDVNNEQD